MCVEAGCQELGGCPVVNRWGDGNGEGFRGKRIRGAG